MARVRHRVTFELGYVRKSDQRRLCPFPDYPFLDDPAYMKSYELRIDGCSDIGPFTNSVSKTAAAELSDYLYVRYGIFGGGLQGQPNALAQPRESGPFALSKT
jgi:hypothetical protein